MEEGEREGEGEGRDTGHCAVCVKSLVIIKGVLKKVNVSIIGNAIQLLCTTL